MTKKIAKFISFEGGEGSGKSSLLSALKPLFTEKKIKAHFTFEPGGSELGKELREVLLKKRDYFSPKAEALIYAAARAQHVEEVIAPLLEAGTHVLTDRYVDASLAYQGVARQLGLKTIRDLNEWAIGGLYPDRTYFFDIDPVIGLSRAKGRHELDRIECEKLDFHARIREAYQHLAKSDSEGRFVIIDAAQTQEQVFAQVSKDLMLYLNQ